MSSVAARRLVAGTLLALAAPLPAEAQEPVVATHEDARWAFVEGTSHFEARRYSDALASFERSYRVVQSPNALLMIARCQRELGRRPEAVATFDRANTEARQRVAAGENRYAPTADAALKEANVVRAMLGTIRIRVEGTATGVVQADGKPLTLSPSGEAVVLREPGTASVEFLPNSGVRHQQTVTVVAGSTVGMTFTSEAAASPRAPDAALAPTPFPLAIGSNRYALPAWIAGGVSVIGAATFVGFGLSSQATYADLARRCGPNRCGPADRALADRGARDQTIANVGLGVAITAAVATVVFVVLALDESRPLANPR